MTDRRTERQVVNEVLDAIGSLPGVLAWRNNTGAAKSAAGHWVRFGLVGSPDVIVVVAGRFVGLECKGPTGRQSEAQMRFAAALSAAGGVYAVVRSGDEAFRLVSGLLGAFTKRS